MLNVETFTGFYLLFTRWEMIPIGIMLLVEWLNRSREHGLQGLDQVVKGR